MGLFGKPRKTELQAAAEFVINTCRQAQTQWPSICGELQPFDAQFESFRDDKIAAYEFTLAAISVEMHAISSLLPAEQGKRIRSHILQCLTTDDVGDYPREAIAEYDVAWTTSLSQAEPPFSGVASVLYDKLGLSSSTSIGGVAFKSPFLIMGLGGAVVQCGAWWKNYIEQHRIVA
jgi:hypothetical protein